jgi:hypothetical protein
MPLKMKSNGIYSLQTKKGFFMKLPVFGMLCACLSLPVFAAEGRWTEGFGQGNLEYFIDAQGVRLYIGCPTKEGSADSASGISLYQISNDAHAKQFAITVDGITYEGPFDADSRVGNNNFMSLLDGLRKGNAVVKVGNKSITYPKSNAAKILPHGKNFPCNMM